MDRRSSPYRNGLIARATGLAFLIGLVAACSEPPTEPAAAAPDVAHLVEGTGSEVDQEPGVRMETVALAARFELNADPRTGQFDLRLVDDAEWEVGVVEADGRFRRTNRSLNDYCIAVESLGIANSVRIDTDRSSIATDDDCPSGFPNGDPALFPYSVARGAYCAKIKLTSNYLVPMQHLYAEIQHVTAGYEMYTYNELMTMGLGNGAEAPITTGNNTPQATFGLVKYPDLMARGDSATEWWIYRYRSSEPLVASGVIVFSPTEILNGIDDDCDGLIDEDLNAWEDGETCQTNLDCMGGVCDCNGFPCGPGETPECRTPYCGDGFVEGVEDCDPGTGADTAFCNFDCTWAVCGDNYVNEAASEDCDPGTIGGFTVDCNDNCTFTECHDGIVNPAAGELCDDGNYNNNDGCVDDCMPAYCGDGHHRTDLPMGAPGYEQCDDGNDDNTDGCVNCMIAVCGDGWVQEGVEECDGDGMGTGGPTANCNADCTFSACGDGFYNPNSGEICDEAGDTQTCDGDCTSPVCGDEYINSNFLPPTAAPGRVGPRTPEQCDAGLNNNNQGACTSDCNWAFCGDGLHRQDISDPDDIEFEQCDDGDPLWGGLNSDTAPDACRTNCLKPYCGDNVIDPSGREQCDDGPLNSDTEPGACRTDCAYFTCGDGVRDPEFEGDPGLGIPSRSAEDCDYGDGVNGDLPDSCRGNCTIPSCGDGVHDPLGSEGLKVQLGVQGFDELYMDPDAFWAPEACDDGNRNNNDDCLSDCTIPTCGDGFLWNQGSGTEQCDDGNNINGDGCSNNCLLEDGWLCSTPGEPCVPICGDGKIRGDEECDDGNSNSNDGCSSTCQIEYAFTCDQPSTELPANCYSTCGDGLKAHDEQCDEGPQDTVTCNANCTLAYCGDGYTNGVRGEQCDDANSSNSDGCLNDCTLNTCGDGWVNVGVEACDGNGLGTGGVTALCNTNCTVAACGDGILNPLHVTSNTVGKIPGGPEQCDMGSNNSNSIANRCRTNCQNPTCGDGVKDDGEECDLGAQNGLPGSGCLADCRLPYCGDGVVNGDEQCDLGAMNNVVGSGCIACYIDADKDGYLDANMTFNPSRLPPVNMRGDCDDTKAAINPGATELAGGSPFFDVIHDDVDQNCDGYNFPVNTGTIRIVVNNPTVDCVGIPSGLTGRCHGSVQDAINNSNPGHHVLVRNPGTMSAPVVLRDSVNVFGGWNHVPGWTQWSNNEAARAPINYVGEAGNGAHVALIAVNIVNSTYVANTAISSVFTGSTTTGALSVHGATFNNVGGLRFVENSLTAGAARSAAQDGRAAGVKHTNVAGFNFSSSGGTMTPSQGNLSRYTTASGTGSPAFRSGATADGGQGNGWLMYQGGNGYGPFRASNTAAWYQTAADRATYYQGNSNIGGVPSGGSSIALLVNAGNNSTAIGEFRANRLVAGSGGAGGGATAASAGGHSVGLWVYHASAANRAATNIYGIAMDAASVQATYFTPAEHCDGFTSSNNNTITVGARGAAGSAGTNHASNPKFGRAPQGFAAKCHRQMEAFEFFYSCNTGLATQVTRSTALFASEEEGTASVGSGLYSYMPRSGDCNGAY